jgi:hypothetical protein
VSRIIKRPSPETLERVRDFAERQLDPEEVEAILRIPIGDEERADVVALISWFRRRYPTPRERLAYIRRATRRWRPGALR